MGIEALRVVRKIGHAIPAQQSGYPVHRVLLVCSKENANTSFQVRQTVALASPGNV